MCTVNIYAAKTHLSRLVEEAAAGEEIIIAKSGKPVRAPLPARRVAEEKGSWPAARQDRDLQRIRHAL